MSLSNFSKQEILDACQRWKIAYEKERESGEILAKVIAERDAEIAELKKSACVCQLVPPS